MVEARFNSNAGYRRCRTSLAGVPAAGEHEEQWPLLSVVMPVHETPPQLLREALDSVLAQHYPYWELWVADDASQARAVGEVLGAAARSDPRIRLLRRTERGHIARATNLALAHARGEFVAFMDHDDRLPPEALECVAQCLRSCPSTDVLFTDSDYLDEAGERCNPFFKPRWDPDLILGQNYVTHLLVVRRALLQAVGGLRPGYEGSQDYDLVLRLAERALPHRIRHLPRVLYHWRVVPDSVARGNLALAARRGREAVSAHLCRRGVRARVVGAPRAPIYNQVRRALPTPPPRVSVLLGEGLAKGVENLLALAAYPRERLQVLVVARDGWKRALTAATGTIAVILSASFDRASERWLSPLVAHALRAEIGLVGPGIIDTGGSHWGAGLVLGLRGPRGQPAVAPAFEGASEHDAGYFHRLCLEHRVSALAGGCLVGRRQVLLEAGGLGTLQPSWVADLDLSLRIRAQGLACLWTPQSTLYRVPTVASPPSTPMVMPSALAQCWSEQLATDEYCAPAPYQRVSD